jgi:hypothetical protein
MRYLTISRLTVLVMAVFFSFSSLAVQAQEMVYYCDIKENLDVKNHNIQKIERYRFMFMTTPEKIIFGDDGYFEGSFINLYHYFSVDEFYGGDQDSVFRYVSPNFYYTDIFSDNIKVITATCDRF